MLDRLVARLDALPRFNPTAERLLAVVQDPASTLAQLVDTIRYDQSVTSELLRLCNSPYAGLSRRISTPEDAVRYLGTAQVLRLVTAAQSRTLLAQPQRGYGLAPHALWRHSVAVALAAQAFGHRCGWQGEGLPFTAGLLHDVGKVVLNELVSAEFAEIVRRVSVENLSFNEAEQQVLGFTHPEVGAQVTSRWSFAPEIVRAIRYHHEPDALPQPDLLVDVVYLADTVALLGGIGLGFDGLLYRAAEGVLARHGLGIRDLENVGAEVVAELKQIEGLFGIREG